MFQMYIVVVGYIFFFFKQTGTTEIYTYVHTLSLHDALPISVAADATVSVEGASYEVEPELAGETVTLLWGLFDQQLFMEHDGKRHGPYEPSRGAVPLYRYRKYQKSRAEERLDKVVRLADPLGLPRATVTGGHRPLPSLPPSTAGPAGRHKPFREPPVQTA